MGSQEKPDTYSNSMQRVKVYRLNEEGKWDDQGTGHVTVDFFERSEALGLFVVDEDDHETLLLHRISSEDVYRKQEDTIISWRDPVYATDLALSFQESKGCSIIWDRICSAQRNMSFTTLNHETFHSINNELRGLPAVELSSIPLIHKTVVEAGSSDQMRLRELILSDQDFLCKLMDLFKVCESLGNIDGLHMIFRIVKGIVMLNSPQIIEKILSDELFMDTFGALEYDPEVSQVQHHRSFLEENVVFKEAIPIGDPLILSKIHQTYRVKYLKDVVLARVLDEAIVANLSSIVHANNAVIISLLKDDGTFIQDLFARLKSSTASEESKKTLVYLLNEFCNLSKSLEMGQRSHLFRDLTSKGIFDIISDILRSEDKKLVLTGADILTLFLNQDPNLLQTYVVQQEGILLLGLLVKGMITDFGDDIHCQFIEILRCLLDSSTMSGVQMDTVIEIFYERHFLELIDVIIESCPSNGSAQETCKSTCAERKPKNQTGYKPEILLSICDFLCFCFLHHQHRMRIKFHLRNAIETVLLLTRRREKYLVVAAVRFMRTALSRRDERLVNHIVGNNLFKPIVDVFIANGNRYNLLHSAILELFEHINKENLLNVIKYIVDAFWNQLAKFESFASVHSLKAKYDQSVDCGTKGGVNSFDFRKQLFERTLEKEEEDYFNEDSDEDAAAASKSHLENVQTQSPLSNGVVTGHLPLSPKTGLVDYNDDEDDEPPELNALLKKCSKKANEDDELWLKRQETPREKLENTDEDEKKMDYLGLKRKSSSKDEEPEQRKRQMLWAKNVKPKDGVFSSLCSTLSNVVVPHHNMRGFSTNDENKSAVEENKQENELAAAGNPSNSSISNENHQEREPTSRHDDPLRSSTDDRQLDTGECATLLPKSSPENSLDGL